jgi:hypothetical protein
MEVGGIIFIVIVAIILAIWIEWIIGKAIGNAVSKGTGLVLGIILILCGFSLLIGIAIIVYSNRNKDEPTININLNTSSNENLIYRNLTPEGKYNLVDTNRQKEIVLKNYENKFIKNNTMTQNNNFMIILAENGLDDYISIFKENHLTDTNIIAELTETDLEKLGINIMGDRKKLINLINDMKKDT